MKKDKIQNFRSQNLIMAEILAFEIPEKLSPNSNLYFFPTLMLHISLCHKDHMGVFHFYESTLGIDSKKSKKPM